MTTASRPPSNPSQTVPVTAVLGPTNTGKTHLAMERLLAHPSGMIGFPLRLLARENYERAVKAKGVEAILVQADMGQDADCRKLAAETLKAWGRIDGLVNNAGTTKFQNQGDLDGVSAEDFDRILRVNVTGPYMMSRAVYPTMKKQWDDNQERGSIVNISSIAGVMGVGTSIPYAASKGALNTLTLSLARWFGPAVRVNTVCPGFIQTRWLLGALGQENYEKLRDAQEQTTPLRQAGTPEQMAEAVIFFLTSASNITGEFLIVDAGTHLGGLPMKGR